MNSNPMLVYNQTPPQQMFVNADQNPNNTGYHTMQQGASFTPLVVQFPCGTSGQALMYPSPQPFTPYQFSPMPQTPQLYLGPQLVAPPPMTAVPQQPMTAVYRPNNFAMQRPSHPLMQEKNHPSFVNNQNGVNLNDAQMSQWKRDPSHMEPPYDFSHARSSPNYNKLSGYRSRVKGPMRGPNEYFGHVQRKVKKKFGFRSKQNMIDKVYLALVDKYEKRGILAGDDEVLRGEDTIRLHVKKFKALQRIEEALQAAERIDSVTIARVSIPLSMKNQFQKKGFLVYVQVEKVWMVPLAQKIFRQFDEFKKCDVARHTTEAETPQTPTVEGEKDVTFVEEAKNLTKETLYCSNAAYVDDDEVDVIMDECNKNDIDDFDGLFTGPMVPQRSCGEMGQ